MAEKRHLPRSQNVLGTESASLTIKQILSTLFNSSLPFTLYVYITMSSTFNYCHHSNSKAFECLYFTTCFPSTPLIAIMGEPRSSGKKWSQAQVNRESRKHLAESKRYNVPDLRVKVSELMHWKKKQFARRVVFRKVHIFGCVPRRCVWQTTHFLRQLNCAVEPNGGDYGRCWVSPRSSKKPPHPMVRRRDISLEIFPDTFNFRIQFKT